MDSLYNKDRTVGKLWMHFSEFFRNSTRPTAKHLFELALSTLALNGFRSVKNSFDHFVSDISERGLKSFYFVLGKGKMEPWDWSQRLIEAALSLLPGECKQPIVLAIDDTMVEKSGERFECRSRLFDHAAHNGSNYLDGHCFVSLLISVPVRDGSGSRYLSFPVAYRMWTKERSKLEMARDLVSSAMALLGKQRQVILCCDSWYPKGCMKDLVKEHENLVMICNVRSDTVIHSLPPEHTGKKGRPKVRGSRLSMEDFELAEVPGSDLLAGSRPVKTRLFGERTVHAIATGRKDGKASRLFLCTKDPGELGFDISYADDRAAALAKASQDFLPLAIYALRWDIEVAYYEQKAFWSLGDYRLRSRVGIERLVNLLTLVYASVKILPYVSQEFHALKGLSPQEARFVLGRSICKEVFFAAFVERIEKLNNSGELVKLLKTHFRNMVAIA